MYFFFNFLNFSLSGRVFNHDTYVFSWKSLQLITTIERFIFFSTFVKYFGYYWCHFYIMKENFNKATWFSYNRLETTTSTNLFHHLHLTTSLKSLKRLHVYPKLLLWATTFFIFMQIYTTTDSVKIFYFWMNNIFIKQYILTSKLLLIRISKLPYSVTRFFSFIFKNAYANWLFFFRIILFSIFLSQMLAEESNDICKIFTFLFCYLFFGYIRLYFMID